MYFPIVICRDCFASLTRIVSTSKLIASSHHLPYFVTRVHSCKYLASATRVGKPSFARCVVLIVRAESPLPGEIRLPAATFLCAPLDSHWVVVWLVAVAIGDQKRVQVERYLCHRL